MRYISKSQALEYLNLMTEKSRLVMQRNEGIACHHDFLSSPEKMEKFDAACMLIQVIGETAKKLDEWTGNGLFVHYPQIYWRGVFGCRNIISHELWECRSRTDIHHHKKTSSRIGCLHPANHQ